MQLRIERLKNNLSRELKLFEEFQPLWQIFSDPKRKLKGDREELRWWFQEWRLSLFAQELKPAISISAKKLHDRL